MWIPGQLPITQSGRNLSDAPFSAQVRQTLDNLQAALESARCTREDMAPVRVYVADISSWPEFNALYAEWMGHHRPRAPSCRCPNCTTAYWSKSRPPPSFVAPGRSFHAVLQPIQVVQE